MKIDKNQILELLRSQGNHSQAEQASGELPDEINTEDSDHQSLLSKFGVDPSSLPDLGGLGKLGKIL